MDRKKVIVLFVILCSGLCYFLVFYFGVLSSFPDSEDEFNIVYIEITETYSRRIYFHCRITNILGRYYTVTGKRVDPQLIRNFAESFTDFYEIDAHEDLHEGKPHFAVQVHLANGEEMTMKSDLDFSCCIPWQVTYRGKSYVQYNGKIQIALLKILVEIDEKKRRYYHKELQWGCYPFIIPEKYASKGISPDFPQSIPVVAPEEKRGRNHVLWEVDVEDTIIEPPLYIDKKMFIRTEHGLTCIDTQTGEILWTIDVKDPISCGPLFSNGQGFVISQNELLSYDTQTGEILWEFQFGKDRKCFPAHFKGDFLVDEQRIYLSSPDFLVYCIDIPSVNVIWRYTAEGEFCHELQIYEDYLVIFTKMLACLQKETGEKVWEITFPSYFARAYEDTIFCDLSEGDHLYDAVVDIPSGEIIWKEELNYLSFLRPAYKDGQYYAYYVKVDYAKENFLICLDMRTMEEIWSYTFDNLVGPLVLLEDRVFLLIWYKDEESLIKYLDKVVLLNANGQCLWEYKYPENTEWDFVYRTDVELFQGIVFLRREEGFIDAFDVDNGERLWGIEIRGEEICTFEVHNRKIYVTADDGRFYCLDFETGEVIWFFEPEKEIKGWDYRRRMPFVSTIEDNVVFVATNDVGWSCNTVFALSLDEGFESSLWLWNRVFLL